MERGSLTPADIVAVTGSEQVFLSPVTIAELKFGAKCAATQAIRQQRFAALARIRTKPVLRIDETTGEIFGSLYLPIEDVRQNPSASHTGYLVGKSGDSAGFHAPYPQSVRF